MIPSFVDVATAWILANGGILNTWEAEEGSCTAKPNPWPGPGSSQQLSPSSCVQGLRSKSSSGLIACLWSTGFPEEDRGNTCPTQTLGKTSGRLSTLSVADFGSQSLEEPRHRTRNCGWAHLTAGGRSCRQACCERGTAKLPLSEDTDSRVKLVQTRLVEVNLLHVQNKPKIVRAAVKAPVPHQISSHQCNFPLEQDWT